MNFKPSTSHLNLMHVTDGAGFCQKDIFSQTCIMVVAPIQWFEKSWRSVQAMLLAPFQEKIYMGLMEASQWLQRMWLHFPFKSVSIPWASIICTGGWSSICRIWRPLNCLENSHNGLLLVTLRYYLFLTSLTIKILHSSRRPTDSLLLSFCSSDVSFRSSRTPGERSQLSLEDSECLWASGKYLILETSMTVFSTYWSSLQVGRKVARDREYCFLYSLLSGPLGTKKDMVLLTFHNL